MSITNHHASFQLWCKGSLIKYQKISKYYDHDWSYLICFVHFQPAGGNFHLFPVDFGPARPGYSYYLAQIYGNLHIESSGDVTSHRMEQGLSDEQVISTSTYLFELCKEIK